jgi:hypothetical protein
MNRNDTWPGRIKTPSNRWCKVSLVDRRDLGGDHAAYQIGGNVMEFADDRKTPDLWQDLVHELFHMAFDHSFGSVGMERLMKRCKTKKKYTSRDLEEDLVLRLEKSWFKILNRNFGFGPEKKRRGHS